jgi:hypothetical protein
LFSSILRTFWWDTLDGVSLSVAKMAQVDECKPLLEGVAAFHGGDTAGARGKLTAAHRRWAGLQLSDESLASLAAMGFRTRESGRALRFCGGDVAAAAAFIVVGRHRLTPGSQRSVSAIQAKI